MKALPMLLIIFFSACVSGAGLQATEYHSGTGAMISSSQTQWETGSNMMVFGGSETYNMGSSGTKAVAGPGGVRYSTESELSFDEANQYTGAVALAFAGGAVAYDSLTMRDLGPNEPESLCDEVTYTADETSGNTPWDQGFSGRFETIGTSGKYQTEKALDDATVAFSGQWEGGESSFKSELFTSAMAGVNKSTTDLNYENGGHRYSMDYGNSSGSQARFEWVWDDWSDPFETQNETPANETVNQTVEEA